MILPDTDLAAVEDTNVIIRLRHDLQEAEAMIASQKAKLIPFEEQELINQNVKTATRYKLGGNGQLNGVNANRCAREVMLSRLK